MSFKLGNTKIGELYVGSNKIAQAYLGSTLVYQSSAPVSGKVYSNDEELAGNRIMAIPKTLVSSGNYIVISYDSKGSTTLGAITHSNRFYYNSTYTSWDRRYHPTVGNYMMIASDREFTKTNDSVENKEDNKYWYTTAYNHTDYHKFKLICQKSDGACSAFVDNNYMGYGTLGVSNIFGAGLWLSLETSYDTPYTKNRRLAWFDNLSDAVVWNG